MWAIGDPPRAAILKGDSGGPLLNGNNEVCGVAAEGTDTPVTMGGSRTFIGTYVDVNDKVINKFLKDTAKSWSANVPSLFRTPGAGGGTPKQTTITPPK
jgi:hypothetical protein